MKIENQVCSLDLSKRLKELGFKQDSLFYLVTDTIGEPKIVMEIDLDEHYPEHTYSAYTVAELGEMLPWRLNGWELRQIGNFGLAYFDISGDQDETRLELINGNTEADARAKMLIYLKENNLI